MVHKMILAILLIFLVPTITSPAGGWTVGSLSDYFGLPTGITGLEVSALWHRAYNLIYNEWFHHN